MKRFALAIFIQVCFLSIVCANPPRNFQESIEYVRSLQTPSGGFLPERAKKGDVPSEPSLRATLAGFRALKYFGGEMKNIKAARQFVHNCYNAGSGRFGDAPNAKGDVFSTAIGLLAVADLKMDRNKYRAAVKYLEENASTFEDIRIAAAAFEALDAKPAKAKAWIAELRKQQNANGTFGKDDGVARMTGGAVAAILRIGGSVQQRDNIIKALKEGQQLNGGYGKGETPTDAELGTTYRVMRTFHMLKAKPGEVEQLRSFVEKCRNNDGGYSLAPAQRSNVAATYFAAIVHYWLKAE